MKPREFAFVRKMHQLYIHSLTHEAMKKIYLVAFLAALVAACSPQPTTGQNPADSTATKPERKLNVDRLLGMDDLQRTYGDESDWSESYEGTIDGKIQVKMDLHGRLSLVGGTITYKNPGKPIMVLGSLEEDGSMFLRELQPDGLVSGVMTGKAKDGKYAGTWSSGDKELKLDLKSTQRSIGNQEWPYDWKGPKAGEYGYHYPAINGDPGAAGTVTIKERDSQYSFAIECVTGPPAYRVATVEETPVELEGGHIRYTMPEGDCQFVVHIYRGFVIVEHISGHYDCGFGMGAGVEGEYVQLR